MARGAGLGRTRAKCRNESPQTAPRVQPAVGSHCLEKRTSSQDARCMIPQPTPGMNDWGSEKTLAYRGARQPAHLARTAPLGAWLWRPHPEQPQSACTRVAPRLMLTWGPKRVSAWQMKSRGQGGREVETMAPGRRGGYRQDFPPHVPASKMATGGARPCGCHVGAPRPAPRPAPPRPASRPAPLARNPAPSRGSYLSENLRRKILSPAEARRCLPTGAFCSRSVLISTPHPPHARMHFYSVPWTPTEIEMSQPKLSNPFSTSWQDHTAETGDLSHVFQIYRNSNCIRR